MTQEEFINKFLKSYIPRNEIRIFNGLINIDGNVDLRNLGLTKIPYPFGIVTGYFDCSLNQLTTLEGAPKGVGEGFNCSHNKLISLMGAPEYVGNTFWCICNHLTTLEGAPKEVGGGFYCQGNNLITLDGIPNYVGGNLYIGKDFFLPKYDYIKIINIRTPKKIRYDIKF